MVKCHLNTDDSQTYISSPNLSPGLQTGIVSSPVSACVISGSSNFTRPGENYEFIKLLLHKLSPPHLPFILHTFNSFYWFFHHNVSESYYISPCPQPWPLIIPVQALHLTGLYIHLLTGLHASTSALLQSKNKLIKQKSTHIILLLKIL